DDPQPPAAALRRSGAARGGAGHERGADRPRGHLRDLPGCPAGFGARRIRRRPHSLATAVAGTLLRADECGARSRVVGPPAPRHAPRLGSAGGHAVIRRAVDLAVAAGVLLLASPLLAAAIVGIRLESRGGAIYRQRRVGLQGHEFDVLKLRTMVAGAEQIGAG